MNLVVRSPTSRVILNLKISTLHFQEWKKKDALQRLCMMRAMRPDRMTYAVQSFIEEKLGSRYVESRSVEFSKSFEESGRCPKSKEPLPCSI